MVKKTGHGKNVDWYLLGVLLYEMLEGIPPFYDHDKDTLFKNILVSPVELGEELSEGAQDLILRLLQKDPEKRLGHQNGAQDIKDHPWFAKIDWKDVSKKRTFPPFPYLYKSKEEHLANLNLESIKAIQQYNNYFHNLNNDKNKAKANHLEDWSFWKASHI